MANHPTELTLDEEKSVDDLMEYEDELPEESKEDRESENSDQTVERLEMRKQQAIDELPEESKEESESGNSEETVKILEKRKREEEIDELPEESKEESESGNSEETVEMLEKRKHKEAIDFVVGKLLESSSVSALLRRYREVKEMQRKVREEEREARVSIFQELERRHKLKKVLKGYRKVALSMEQGKTTQEEGIDRMKKIKQHYLE